jgi:hypothetical protein
MGCEAAAWFQYPYINFWVGTHYLNGARHDGDTSTVIWRLRWPISPLLKQDGSKEHPLFVIQAQQRSGSSPDGVRGRINAPSR